ncbi:allantoicase-like isoform X3 [Amphibalanus amphitrite]|uniref:allantoicase-like isoform X3 n=2 Tax=Amphibalanus amphitrite TaxID=1232801 RepID=UPI001C9044D2|nr:allantoicase-like isoform X3 [Amphibalanus amphitrite]
MAIRQEDVSVDIPRFAEMNNLTAGTECEILFATDDWFAAAENLTKATEPIFKEGLFSSEGKWMDGWETRRKRIPGHDWCIIKLAMPAVIYGVDFDTAFFTGNYVPRASVQAALLSEEDLARFPPRRSGQGKAATAEELKAVKALKTERWQRITSMCRLRAGYRQTRHNFAPVSDRNVYNVVRLNAFPDGGIARLNVYGHACPAWDHDFTDEPLCYRQLVDLVLAKNGGVCVMHSNAHYGHPRNLIAPGRGVNMGDGWETARRLDRPAILEADHRGVLRVPGEEWAIFRLGHRGTIVNIEVDTCHFKGNFPDAVRVEGCDVERFTEDTLDTYYNWTPILLPQKLEADKQHYYSGDEVLPHQPVTYVRVTMSPDGGISRLRLHGRRAFDRFQTWTHGIDAVQQALH